jgi:tRNA uracil 4-sulfurtransferase
LYHNWPKKSRIERLQKGLVQGTRSRAGRISQCAGPVVKSWIMNTRSGKIQRLVVVHYAEIGLKGRNRPFFERHLQENIRRRLAGLAVKGVRWQHGRFLVSLADEAGVEEVLARLRTVPGIAYAAPAYGLGRDLEALKAAIVQALPPPSQPVSSFRVQARRADKGFPLTSPEINAELGAHVRAATGWRVDLSNPDLVVWVEVLQNMFLFYLDRVAGMGGLPVGASGTVGLLLSGGIDSPVAGYYALKRGCRTVAIHFHSGPFGDWLGSEFKIRSLVTHLQGYGLEGRYYVVPIGEMQREMVVNAPAPPRVLLYRRLMFRVAEALTLREGGLALVTGENLGQVASQTLESLGAVQAAATLPVLRPLIGLDKQEIVALAQGIGTYDLSIDQSDDCCQFLVPRQVVTRPTVAEIDAAEANLDVEGMVSAAMAAARLESVAAAAGQARG